MSIAVTPDFSMAMTGNGRPVRVDTAELVAVSLRFEALAVRYEQVGRRLVPLTAQVGALAALDVSGQGAEAFSRLTLGAVTLLALAGAARELAGAVAQSAANYEAADAFAHEVFVGYRAAHNQNPGAVQSYGSAFGYRVGSLKLRVEGGAKVVRAEAEQKAWTLLAVPAMNAYLVARRTPAGRWAIAGTTDYLHDKAQAFGLVRGLRAYENITEEVDPWLDPDTGESMKPQEAPVNAADLTEMNYLHSGAHDAVDAHYGSEGYVNEWDHSIIQRYIDPATGEERVIVSIPGSDGELEDFLENYRGGTLSWAENLANASLLDEPDVPLSESSAAMQLIDQILREEGISSDTPIMLNGYSQGGVVAMALAQNKEFRSRYRVQVVATQGSPVNSLEAPPQGVAHIRMENRQDYVPKTQGENPNYRATEEYFLNHSEDPHGSKRYYLESADAEHFNQESEVLATFFNGDFHTAGTAVYAGSSQKPDLTKTELEQQQLLGVAHGTADVRNDVKNVLDTLGSPKGRIPTPPGLPSTGIEEFGGTVNPSELYQEADTLVDWFNDEVILPADNKLDEILRNIKIGDLELHSPDLSWNPGGRPKPPIPMPDDGIKTYSPAPLDASFTEGTGGEDAPFEVEGAGVGSNF